MSSPIGEILALAGMVGNTLALPSTVKRSHDQAALERAVLAQMPGVDAAAVNAMMPQPGLSFLNPDSHPGTFGKVLQGVGDVGTIISSILGQGQPTPRVPLASLTAIAQLKHAQERGEAIDARARETQDRIDERARLNREAADERTAASRAAADARHADTMAERRKKKPKAAALEELNNRRAGGARSPEFAHLTDKEVAKLAGVARSGGLAALLEDADADEPQPPVSSTPPPAAAAGDLGKVQVDPSKLSPAGFRKLQMIRADSSLTVDQKRQAIVALFADEAAAAAPASGSPDESGSERFLADALRVDPSTARRIKAGAARAKAAVGKALSTDVNEWLRIGEHSTARKARRAEEARRAEGR